MWTKTERCKLSNTVTFIWSFKCDKSVPVKCVGLDLDVLKVLWWKWHHTTAIIGHATACNCGAKWALAVLPNLWRSLYECVHILNQYAYTKTKVFWYLSFGHFIPSLCEIASYDHILRDVDSLCVAFVWCFVVQLDSISYFNVSRT